MIATVQNGYVADHSRSGLGAGIVSAVRAASPCTFDPMDTVP
jgi:hypothetical protein